MGCKVEKYEAAIRLFVEYINSIKENDEAKGNHIPVGVSNRHIHLSQEDLEALFGSGYTLTNLKDLSQPGQYACKETVILCGPKGVIEKVRVLGPVRRQTQVEILAGDCFKLGIQTEPRLSGELAGTPGITLIGPRGSVQTAAGVILAKRHIHMLPEDAERFGVGDGQEVKIRIPGDRGGVFDHVVIRVTEKSGLEFHLDTEEANALGVTSESLIEVVKQK